MKTILSKWILNWLKNFENFEETLFWHKTDVMKLSSKVLKSKFFQNKSAIYQLINKDPYHLEIIQNKSLENTTKTTMYWELNAHC